MDFAEDILLPVLALLLVFGTIFGLAYMWMRTRNEQRLALIEKGHGAGLADQQRNAVPTLRWATFLAGVACGLLAGEGLVRYTSLAAWVSYLSMLMLGTAAGLVAGNILAHRASD